MEARRAAQRWFWWLLAAAACVSLGGNVANAVLPHLPILAVKVGVAAVPPLAVLAAVHGLGHLGRARGSGRAAKWTIAAIVSVLLSAFTLSFAAQYHLALAIGHPKEIAWLYPLTVDVLLAAATFALIVLRDAPVEEPAENPTYVDASADLIAEEIELPVETVLTVLQAHANGESINGAAGIAAVDYLTADKILQAAKLQVR